MFYNIYFPLSSPAISSSLLLVISFGYAGMGVAKGANPAASKFGS